MSVLAFVIVCIVVWFAFMKGKSDADPNRVPWPEFIDSVKAGVYYRSPGLCGYNEFGMAELAFLSYEGTVALVEAYINRNPYNQHVPSLHAAKNEVVASIALDRLAAWGALAELHPNAKNTFKEQYETFRQVIAMDPKEFLKTTQREREAFGVYGRLSGFARR